MFELTSNEILFVASALTFQLILIAHFTLRRWRFELSVRFGWIIYALSIPAATVSLYLLSRGEGWYLWLGGFIYLIWAIYGVTVDYMRKIEWRNTRNRPVFGAYVTLYLVTVMFYWWPLAQIEKTLWYVGAGLFILSTFLNITSHRKTNLSLKES
ncbi:MAG: hypothetical protein ACM3H7_06355 [Acidobacteriaceae bacterium]